MHSNSTDEMLFHKTEQSVQAVIQHLDQSVWNKVAIKAISKMPKPIITGQTNIMLKDFAFVSTDMFYKGGAVTQENEKPPPIRELQLPGFAQLVKKPTRHSVTQVNQEPIKKLTARRKYIKSERIKTEESLIRSANLAQTKADPFYRLKISQSVDKQQVRIDDLMRSSKYEILRYNQKLQKSQREQSMMREQRALTQQRKMKDSKGFTYDFEGRIITVPPKKAEKLKICNIKSYFEATGKRVKPKYTVLNQNFDDSRQRTTKISNKWLISGDSKLFVSQQERKKSSFSFKGRQSVQNNLMDLFQTSKDVEKGVSIIDMGTHSKILGDSNSKQDDRLKLSQFKQIKSSFKPRITKFTASIKNSSFGDINEVSKASQPKKEHDKLRIDSGFSSRLMSSSFSPFMERSGRINKNQRTYTDYFE